LTNELNVLALVKGLEHYIFIYDDDSRQQLIDNFRDLAADPAVNLSWFDAVVLTTKAREQETSVATPLEEEAGVRGKESGLRNQEFGIGDADIAIDGTEAPYSYKHRFFDS
jgi:hypothetical protein